MSRAFLFLPLLPLHFIFFNFLLPKNDFDSLFDSLTVVVRQKLLFVLDTQEMKFSLHSSKSSIKYFDD